MAEEMPESMVKAIAARDALREAVRAEQAGDHERAQSAYKRHRELHAIAHPK